MISDGKQFFTYRLIIYGKASVVMRQLYQSVVLKRKLCAKAKIFVFTSVFVPILTYGHEYWVMTERVRSQVQAAKCVSCEKSEVYPYLTKLVKSTDIVQFLNIEPLLLYIERSQLR